MKRGERYISKVWLNPNGGQARMKITKVTKHTIYYRPDYSFHDDGSEWLGSVACFDNTPAAISKYLDVTVRDLAE